MASIRSSAVVTRIVVVHVLDTCEGACVNLQLNHVFFLYLHITFAVTAGFIVMRSHALKPHTAQYL